MGKSKKGRVVCVVGEGKSVNQVGSGLLSHTVSRAVPSALAGLTTGFGMGPGVPPQL